MLLFSSPSQPAMLQAFACLLSGAALVSCLDCPL